MFDAVPGPCATAHDFIMQFHQSRRIAVVSMPDLIWDSGWTPYFFYRSCNSKVPIWYGCLILLLFFHDPATAYVEKRQLDRRPVTLRLVPALPCAPTRNRRRGDTGCRAHGTGMQSTTRSPCWCMTSNQLARPSVPPGSRTNINESETVPVPCPVRAKSAALL